jgi:dihydroxyacid dehydratase/phosphogluconate dehydratase
LTAALRYLPFGKHVALLTDARFSGVSTGACIGLIGPEALQGGPLGKLRDGDRIQIEIDRQALSGHIDFVASYDAPTQILSPAEGAQILKERLPHPDLKPDPHLPDDTRLWAALQDISGGVWNGAVYDVERILAVIAAGKKALDL